MSASTPSKSEKQPSECMVCGKLFPRGVLDLQRHQNAITLQHTVCTKSSAGHSKKCERCNLYFSSDEHIQMHNDQTSCKKRKSNNENSEKQVSITPTVNSDKVKKIPPSSTSSSAQSKSDRIVNLSSIESPALPILERKESDLSNSSNKRSKRMKVLVPTGKILLHD
jgi:hypothetical protein